jgi:hypothetical protein
MKRKMTDEERGRQRTNMEQAWADGKFDDRRQGMHPRHWIPAQNQAFMARAGTMPITEIADALERQFYIRRTIHSLRIQAKRFGISLWQVGLSMRDLESLFGIDHKHIKRFWIDGSHLTGRRWGARGANEGWSFDEREVARFIRECGWLFDLERMQKGHRLTMFAETARKSNPWVIGYVALSELLGLATHNILRWVRRGVIQHLTRATGGRGKMICVRGLEISVVREAIREAQARSRAANVARFTAMRHQPLVVRSG